MKTTGLNFTEGSILKKMITYSLPIFLTNVLQTSYQFVDSLWVGNLLGAGALGAISISSTVIFTILSFIIGINSATLTILSQQKGSGDDKSLAQSLNAFVFVLGIFTLGLGIIGFFCSAWLLRILGTPDDLMPLATLYLQINFLGIVFLFGYSFIGTVLRALGNSKAPVRFVILAVLLNAVLDPVMIAWFDLGIEGAAFATVIAQGAAFVYGMWYSIRKVGVPFTLPRLPEKRYAKAVLRLGLPGGLQMIAVSSGMLLIISVVASFGKDAVAGFGAAQRIDSIILLPAFTLGSVVNSMAGQNIGAQLWGRVVDVVRNAMLLILVLSFSISTIVFFSAEALIRMFVSDLETVRFGTEYLKTIAFFYPFTGINFVLNGTIRASGAMMQVLVLNIISFWVLRYPLAYFFSAWFGERGIALGIGMSFICSSLAAGIYYFLGNWRNAVALEKE